MPCGFNSTNQRAGITDQNYVDENLNSRDIKTLKTNKLVDSKDILSPSNENIARISWDCNSTNQRAVIIAKHLLVTEENENTEKQEPPITIINSIVCPNCLTQQADLLLEKSKHQEKEETYQQEIREIRAELQCERQKREENEQMYWQIIKEIKESSARNLIDLKHQMETLYDEEFQNSSQTISSSPPK